MSLIRNSVQYSMKKSSNRKSKGDKIKKCHMCEQTLSREYEGLFSHCFECGLKRLEKLGFNFDPCLICNKGNNSE